MNLIQNLRQQNVQVSVTHHRQFVCGVQDPQLGLDTILTRREFETAAEQGRIVGEFGLVDKDGQPYPTIYGQAVLGVGGFSEVEITIAGTTEKAKFNFNKNKPFNRKLGSNAAVNRALKKFGDAVLATLKLEE